MKKRLIGTLLMGALFVSSTSVFVSCKDYDDDINNIVATKADKTALEEAQKALQSEINSLKTQLESVNGQITALTNNKADKTEVEAVWAKLNPLIQKASNLETRIGEAETAIAGINALIGGKLEGDLAGKTYKQALEETWAKAVAASTSAGDALAKIAELQTALNDPTTGLKAVVNDLKGQVEALNAYKAKVDAIQADYLKAADKTELLNKIDALKTELTGKINDLEGKLTTAIATAKSEAKSEAVADAKAYTDAELEKVGVTIEGLRTNMQELTTKIDNTVGLVNTLNVYVRSLLRGLVFQMQSFYEGIEATDITILNYRIYPNVPDADADKMEARGYTSVVDFKGHPAATFAESDANRASHDYDPLDITTRYFHKDTTRVLTFQAKYYMNPSSAAVDADSKVIVEAFDRPYHSGLNTQGAAIGDTAIYTNEFNGKTTTYCANIKPISWKTDGGMLIVDYDANPDYIRTIRDDQAVTMFATQVAVNKDGLDTLITSDFATLYKKVVKDIVLSHTPSTSTAGIHNGASYATHPADSVNTHCGKCAYNHSNPIIRAEYAAGLHLMQTVAEAAGLGAHGAKTADQFNCQDMVYWNDSLDLSKLVEVHYTTEGGDHTILTPEDAAYNGLHFKYELTGLYYGGNVTSESAHAAIKDSLFRPQMPDSVFENGVWVGKAAPWDNGGKVKGVIGKQDRQTIGRTPLVRVELLDKDNKILDYGYIRIRITERPGVVPTVLPKTYTYNAGEMKASEAWCGDNTASPFSFKQKWIQMEYDIHHDLDLTQAEFEKYYVADAAGGEFQQYYIDGSEYKKVVAAPSVNEKLGTIAYKRESADEATTVIEWDVTAAQLLTYINHCGTNPGQVTRLVKFANPTGYKGLPDVYVAIVAKPLTVAAAQTPTAKINWDGRKILNYWYAKDSQVERSGLTEVHANVYGVEDEKEARAYTFKQTIQAAFVGNKIADITDDDDIKSFIEITNGPADVYANLHLALKFVLGANTEFKGYLNGVEKTFVCVLRDQNRLLTVYRKDDPTKAEQNVARLIYGDVNDSLNVVDVRYQHSDYAEAMLNYRRHNALNDDVLTAYVAVTARYKNCPFFVSDPINVRFLRPINVENNDKEVEDAAVNQKQIIYLRDLVKLSDWREQAFKTNYWYYYNIKSIEVIGVSKNGGTFDQNDNIVTNMHQAVDSDPATPLKDVSKLVEFKYYGTNPGNVYNYTDANTSTTAGNAVPDLVSTSIPGLADYGCIVYTNLGSNVQKFKVRIPIKVVYQWGNNQGAIFTTVDINVLKTHENARQK